MSLAMKRLLSIMILLAALFAAAQPPQPSGTAPVRWRTIVKQTGDDTGTVTFRALIADGWHMYGLEMPAGGPKATSFDLGASTGVIFDGVPAPSRRPLTVDDPLFGMTLQWWDANVDFTVPFRLSGDGTPVLKATVSYMTCDGNTCRPPARETIATPIRFKTTGK